MSIAWQPSASIEALRQRAHLLKKIRDFFAVRQVMEVETPLLCHSSVTDPHIDSIPASLQWYAGKAAQTYYLQTSPEYAMKRLLAAGSGAIYQICKAFRQGDIGRFHNPEFTMLEWYRPGFDYHKLMQEVDTLLQEVANCKAATFISYQEIFLQHLQIDPFAANEEQLKNCAHHQGINLQDNRLDKDSWLQLLLSHCIEPHLGFEKPCVIYDFPASQAALARLAAHNPQLACRFEVYIQGMEIANGFDELQDAKEQRQRFEKNILQRQTLGKDSLPIDEKLLAALKHGLPASAGVALGLDRLLMIISEKTKLADVLSFDIHLA